jgi:hypothetical protein
MTAKRCPQCQTELPADAPEGLCPACLLRGGLPSRGSTAPYGAFFRPPAPLELAPHFPHLEITELIGAGGMGAVYKARQVRLDRPVALKVLPPEVGRDPAFAERFLREARTLARLSHPHIVTVHDFGEAGGFYYFLMEFVDGVNLRQALRAGRFTPGQALGVVPQICDALQYAHDKGVVHRDIKPENLLLTAQGQVKIADFGLAKLLGRDEGVPTLTGTRQVLGTPHYMAPEQMEHPETVDHRADIFSLGVLFYEMLTGELPLGRFPPPSSRVQIDLRLDEIVLRALEKEPERRFQKASDVRSEVEAVTQRRKAAPPRPAAAPQDTAGMAGFPLGIILACALALFASFMPWVTTFGQEATAWTSSMNLWGLDFPNRLVALTACAIAALALLRWQGADVPRALIPCLAVYGLAHTGLLTTVVSKAHEPALSHLLTLAGFFAILVVYAKRPTAARADRAPTVEQRRAIREWLVWPARALMFVGVLACMFWFAWLAVLGMGTFDPRTGFSTGPPTIAYVVAGAGLVLGALIIHGATHMSRLDNFGLAYLAAWLALVPLGPLGWPAAALAWWALTRPGVRAAFRSSRAAGAPVAGAAST